MRRKRCVPADAGLVLSPLDTYLCAEQARAIDLGACIVRLSAEAHGHHLRVRAHLSGIDASEWSRFDFTSADELRAALARMVGPPVALNLSVEAPPTEPPPPSPRTLPRDVLERLWSCTHQMSEEDAAALAERGQQGCPICLVDIDAGDELFCMPCGNGHLSHWRCARPWLQVASTCPLCRYEMIGQAGGEGRAEEALMDESLAAVQRLRQQIDGT
jgi:hypothetical protein